MERIEVPQCGSNDRDGDRVFKCRSFELFIKKHNEPDPEILVECVNCSAHDCEDQWMRHAFLHPTNTGDLWEWLLRVVGQKRLDKIENKLHLFHLSQILRGLIEDRKPTTGLDLNVYLLN